MTFLKLIISQWITFNQLKYAHLTIFQSKNHLQSQTNTNPDLPKKKLTTTTSKPVQNVPVKAEHTVIEERVKQKEQILKQTLESRKLKMIEEEKRLQMVQKQLKDLEGPMRTDVSIIRNQIEQCDKELSAEGKELEILEKAYFEKQKSYARKMLVFFYLFLILNSKNPCYKNS